MPTEVEQRLADALRLITRFVESRPADATEDDDVRALEDVGAVLHAASPSGRIQLVELLGPETAQWFGLTD